MSQSSKYHVPFNDLSIKNKEVRGRYLSALEKVMEHGRVLLGPEVNELEERLANYCNRKYAVGVGSGTDALIVALMSLDIGVGDEVILGAVSWIASANAIRMVGATPVFVDVGEDLNIDPETIEDAITPKTKAIIAVDYTGKICDMDSLSKIASNHHIHLIEDAAQAFGARYKAKIAGSFGVISTFSMNPMKVYGTLGEAGAVLTDSEDIKNALVELRYNGMRDRVKSCRLGFNARIDTLHAALLLCRLEEFPQTLQRRQDIARQYDEHITSEVLKPKTYANSQDTYFCYHIKHPHRDLLFQQLTQLGIECKTREWDYLPAHPSLNSARVVSANTAKRLSEELICLPIFDNMTDEDVKSVCMAVNEACAEIALAKVG
ncbi:MAG: DegT/DnrJ/EryC1/StrS family aminotransferase [Pseudomonadota bacterium]